MSDSRTEGLGLAKLFVHVVWEKISAMASVHNYIGFRDCPTESDALVSDRIIFKILLYFQGVTFQYVSLCAANSVFIVRLFHSV